MRCSIRSPAEFAALLPWLLLALPSAAFAADAGLAEPPSPTHLEATADPGHRADADVQPASAEAGASPSAEAEAEGEAPPVPASPSTAELLARRESALAQRDYDLGRFNSAVAHYGKAYEAMALPELLFNVGQCHRQLKHFDEAAFFYRRYLDLAGAPRNAQLTRELLAEVEQRQKEKESFERELARSAARALTSSVTPRENPEVPLIRRWWLWAAAAGVVAAGAGAAALYATQAPAPTLGTVNAQ